MSTVPTPEEMIAVLQEQLASRPESAELRYQLGTAQAVSGQLEEAVSNFRRALVLRPLFPDAQGNLGNALRLLGLASEALAAYETALVSQPKNARLNFYAGLTAQQMGRADVAQGYFARAVELAPDQPALHRALAESKCFMPGDTQLPQMEALTENLASMSKRDRIQLHFALGKAYDDLGRISDAFAHYSRGNALKRTTMTYYEHQSLSAMIAMANGYSKEAIMHVQDAGDRSDLPVFILGMPRSGTTLMEQVLASHPDVHGAGEIKLFAHCTARVLPEVQRTFFPEGMTAEQLEKIGHDYVEAIRPLAPDAKRIINKLPGNFVYSGLIHLALPNARIIHMRRQPLDTCFSCFTKLFNEDNAFSYDLSELGRYCNGYLELMSHWRSILPRRAFLEVSYEELVTDFEDTVRKVIKFCGLEWDPACLNFYKSERAIPTASALEVRRPVFQHNIGRARAYMDHLQPLITALNNPVAGRRASDRL